MCPACKPDEDFRYAGVSWCGEHQPDRTGSEDKIASPLGDSVNTMLSEAGGEENRKVCDFLHRRLAV
jgi:hypothetical protein